MSQQTAVKSQIDKAMRGVHTATPARIVGVVLVDGRIKRVNVKPQVRTVFQDGVVLDRSVIKNVPLQFPSGGGAYQAFPVKIGDPVLLIFTEDVIENWLEDGLEQNPHVMRRFSINDCFAIPGAFPFTESPGCFPDKYELKYGQTYMTIGEDGTVVIESEADMTIQSRQDLNTAAAGNQNISSDGVTTVNGAGGLVLRKGESGDDLIETIRKLSEEVSKIKVSGAPIENKVQIEALTAAIASFKP